MSNSKAVLFRFGLVAAVASLWGVSLSAQSTVPGSYELSFFRSVSGVLEPVSSLAVCTQAACEELILKAHVEEEGSGLPASGGAVSFQYCSRKGLPNNDITRADEAPSATCDSRAGSWSTLTSFRVDESGDAHMNFGIVMIPRTVGFRFRYTRRGGAVSSGTSAPIDFLWVAPE